MQFHDLLNLEGQAPQIDFGIKLDMVVTVDGRASSGLQGGKELETAEVTPVVNDTALDSRKFGNSFGYGSGGIDLSLRCHLPAFVASTFAYSRILKASSGIVPSILNPKPLKKKCPWASQDQSSP